MKTAFVVLSDNGQPEGKNTIPLNDMRAIEEIFKAAGCSPRILYRENLNLADPLRGYDSLFVFYGGLVNYGGRQSKPALRVIDLINKFDGNVIIFNNDVILIDNKPRDGFKRITRPVIYASPHVAGGSAHETADLDITDEVEINQSFVIGKKLSKLPDVDLKPVYDVVYGGRDRPAMRRRLLDITETHTLLAYADIRKVFAGRKNVTCLKNECWFNNAELRVLNSFGKYSLMLSEKRKEYFTSRVFEQLFSNSIVLFDRQMKVYKMFWQDDNTFSEMIDLLKLLDVEYSEKRVKRQHEMARSFNYDKYINQEAEKLADVLS